MKKLLALLLAIAVVFSLSACGNEEKQQTKGSSSETVSTVTDKNEDNSSESKPATDDVDSSVPVTDTDVDTNTDGTTDWREFLAEYEDWVDRYLDLYNRCLENPTDTSILTECNEMLAELTDWSERASDVQVDLTDPDEITEYTSELTRIIEKLDVITE